MIIVDCSAVVDALTGAPGVAELVEMLSAEDLHAPELLDYEVVAALCGLVLGRRLSVERAEEVLIDFADLPIERWPAEAPLRHRAFQLREGLSAYDAAYVALAEALECPLVTRDRRLALAGGHAARISTW
ncbi:MAG: type II toxin-antitoxin system VapC family toxin [Actinomycetes bacterium]